MLNFLKCSNGYKEEQTIKDSGIGLAIVKLSVDKLGGVISLDNTAGKETQFNIIITITKK
jgi:sensor histidine kinase regulating citrate/malate metabolism